MIVKENLWQVKHTSKHFAGSFVAALSSQCLRQADLSLLRNCLARPWSYHLPSMDKHARA